MLVKMPTYGTPLGDDSSKTPLQLIGIGRATGALRMLLSQCPNRCDKQKEQCVSDERDREETLVAL